MRDLLSETLIILMTLDEQLKSTHHMLTQLTSTCKVFVANVTLAEMIKFVYDHKEEALRI
jgi:predicted nucleic-acid-binding protein